MNEPEYNDVTANKGASLRKRAAALAFPGIVPFFMYELLENSMGSMMWPLL
jgi:hypothetical protein